MPTLELVLRPLGNSRYAVINPDGTELLRSKVPFYASCRAVPEDTWISMRHEGSDIEAMRGRAGDHAGWTVSEADRGGLRRVRYDPHAFDRFKREQGED